MSAFLRLAVGVSVLMCAPAAAQIHCPGCTDVGWVDISLKDDAGNVRAIMRVFRGEPGKRQISFIDAASDQVINTVTVAPTASANPLSGAPLPAVTLPDAKGDLRASIEYLQSEVDSLKDQLNAVVDRINAAAGR